MAPQDGSRSSRIHGHRYDRMNYLLVFITLIFGSKQVSGGSVGDNDNWGTKDLNTCCGRMNVLIPKDIPAGDYLLRAEALALHTASSVGGAQFYMTCCTPKTIFPLSITHPNPFFKF
jgi:hypothetical protein